MMNGSVGTKARGGRAVYGAALGILMLEARFPRIPGDVGNALSFPFPVHYRVVRDASPDRVVRQGAPGLLAAFIDAAKELVAMGADGITTNCGFLSIFQKELSAAVEVPVASSSLMQLPMVESLLPPGRRAGIITIDKTSLTPHHLACAGLAADTPVEGVEEGRELARVILGDEPTLDVAAAEADMIEAGRRLVERHPEVGAIVLECTNMCPYAARLSAELALPVHDMVGFLAWFQGGLRPRRFPPPEH